MQSNRCQNPPPQLSKIIFVTRSTGTAAREKANPDDLVFVKLGATKPPNKSSGEAFADRFRGFAASLLRAHALKLLKPPSYAGYKSFWMQRRHEKVSLFRSMTIRADKAAEKA